MKHEIQYRRVLKTKEEYLGKYIVFGTCLMAGWILKLLVEQRAETKKNRKLSNGLQKIKNSEKGDEPLNVHENWYMTIFDKRLWILTQDLMNLSVIL